VTTLSTPVANPVARQWVEQRSSCPCTVAGAGPTLRIVEATPGFLPHRERQQDPVNRAGYKNTKYLTKVVFMPHRNGGYWSDKGYEWYGGT